MTAPALVACGDAAGGRGDRAGVPGSSLAHGRCGGRRRVSVIVVLVTPRWRSAAGRPFDPRARRGPLHRGGRRGPPRPVAGPARPSSRCARSGGRRRSGDTDRARRFTAGHGDAAPEPGHWIRARPVRAAARDEVRRLPRLQRRLHARPNGRQWARAGRSTARARRSTPGPASSRYEIEADRVRAVLGAEDDDRVRAVRAGRVACRRAATTSRMPRSRARRSPSPAKPGRYMTSERG